MQALDELVARWRKNPDPESTLALCAHLGAAPEADLIREVANAADAWHHDNHAVMLSVGRMHLDAGLLAEAQAALLRAGKLSPNDASAYRYLGEVLLRRGDAARSERALARALELGAGDDETRLWHERAIVYAALQARQGMTAVADEVARTAPLPGPASSRPNPGHDTRRDNAGGSRAARRSRPPPTGRLRPSAPKPSRRRGSTPPAPELGAKSAPHDTLLMGRSPLPAPALKPARTPSRPRTAAAAPPRLAGAAERGPASARGPGAARSQRGAGAAPDEPPLAALLRDAESLAQSGDASGAARRADAQPPSDPFDGTFGDEHARAPRASAGLEPSAPLDPPAALPRAAPLPVAADVGSPEAAAEAPPSPEAVLLALARVGLYELDGGVVPAWEAAPRPSPRRLWVMAGGLLAAAALGIGAHRYALGVQRERLAQAQELGMQLASALESGSRARLSASEADFQRLFELDSRGREAALLWLENRALHALLGREPVSGIESALQRARSLGIEETQLVFGRLASALVAGDVPGGSATIAEWDARARQDALYQLFAGAVLERAGNPGALERYTLATRLQPDLQVAHIFAARLALLQLEPGAGRSTLEIAHARLGPGPAADVLRGLAWASSPSAGAPPALPPEEALASLPAGLADAAQAVLALRALREGRLEEAKAAFERALGPSATPALTDWIGSRALEAGDADVARRAAAKTADPSAPRARALGARIALGEGRLEAARSAARGLDPSSREAVLIEAISAYENLDGAAAARLAAGLAPEPGASQPEPLREGAALVTGAARLGDERLQQLAQSRHPWAALIAVDVALDTGRAELAERLLRAGRWPEDAPAVAARLARLRRAQGQSAAALPLAPLLLARESASARGVAEAVLVLVDGERPSAALEALRDGGVALGALQPWLEVIVEAARGRHPSAAKSAAALGLPDKGEPVLTQLLAMRALAAVKDRRARAYHAQLERRFRGQHELDAAALALGITRP